MNDPGAEQSDTETPRQSGESREQPTGGDDNTDGTSTDDGTNTDQKSEAGPSGASDGSTGPVEEPSLKYWQSLTEDELMHSYNAIGLYYQSLLEEFRNNANEAVDSYVKFDTQNATWRRRLIIATGGLAILNVLAATDSSFVIPWTTLKLRDFLSICAAVYAAGLALLTNLESFYNYPDKKNNTRESRELYLDAFRQFEMLRLNNVYPFGYSAIACYNFQALYRRLVLKDVELRRKIMQLSQTQAKQG